MYRQQLIKEIRDNQKDMEKSLKLGIAAGSASAFSKNLATKEEIDALFHIL